MAEQQDALQDSLVIRLDAPITGLNGQEAWQEVPLREPYFHEVSGFYKERDKTNPHDAMAWRKFLRLTSLRSPECRSANSAKGRRIYSLF